MKTNIDELIENMFIKVAELEQNSKDEELSLQDQLKEWVQENKPELQDKIQPKDVSEKSNIQQEKEFFEPQSAEVEIPPGMTVEQIIEQVLNDTSPYKEKMLVLESVRNSRLGELKMKTNDFFQAASKGDFKRINEIKEEQDSLKIDLDKLDEALEKLYNYFATNTSTFVPKKKISQLSKRAKEKHSNKCPECSYVAFPHNGSLVCTNSRCDNYNEEANREFLKSKKPLKKDYEHLDTFTSAKHPISKRAEDKFIKLPDDVDDVVEDESTDVKSLVDQILAPTKDNQHGALTFSEGYYNIKEWDDSTDVVYLKPIYTENSLVGYRMTYPDGVTHNIPEGEARQLVVSPLETIEANLKPFLKLKNCSISIRAKEEDDDEPTKDYPKSKRNVFYSKSVKSTTPHGNKEWKQIGDILIHPDKFTALIKTDVNGKTFYTIIDPNGKVIDDEATTLP